MEPNHTNQIRVFLEKTDTLLDIKYDNSKGVTHAVKTYEAKMFKKIPKIDGGYQYDELPPYFVENDPIETMVIKLIYEDRRGRLKQGMSV